MLDSKKYRGVVLKNWVLPKKTIYDIEKISKESGVSKMVAELLVGRDIHDSEGIKKFMNPVMRDLHDPFLLKDMDKAVDRIVLAIAKLEKILIYGDYDVDGTTSSSVLYRFFNKIGVSCEVYIPSRFEEGYGLSMAAVEKLKKLDFQLIITVDCGIASVKEVDEINKLDLDIIITDHHQCQEVLPAALAIVNPHRPDCCYPFKELCGVGVTFKVISALAEVLKLEGATDEYIDTVALGTVADIVPLIDENRIFVYHGLKKMNNAPSAGLRTLIDVAGLKGKDINSYSIAFGLAPRINAAGRLGDAMRAVKLLSSENEEEAKELAMELNSENMLRQQTEGEIVNEVIAYIEREHDFKNHKVIVASGINWHHGVIGIVASKIVEKYYLPCIILCNEDGVLRGSARSIEGFNIFQALTGCNELLEKYGGHEMAAGLTINEVNLENFKLQINMYANSNLKRGHLVEKIYLDAVLPIEETNLDVAAEVKKIAPFGQGNASPIFLCKDLKIQTVRAIGDGKHLKFTFSSKGKLVDGIGFNMGDLADIYKCGDIVDIVCSLDINSYNNVDKVQLIIKDIRYCEEEYIKYSYYSTIDKTIIYNKTESLTKQLPFNTLKSIDEDNLVQTINNFIANGEKCIFLVNDLKYVVELSNIIEKVESTPYYRININYLYEETDVNLYIILNPTIETIIEVNSYNTIISGRWLDQIYLESVVNSIDNERLFLYNYISGVSIIDGTGFDREDIKAVYKFIWDFPGDSVIINNVNNFVNDINNQYSRLLNIFSFEKCIEILNEVGLIKVSSIKSNCFKIDKLDNNGKKVLLEDSTIYRKMISLLK